MKLWDIVLLSLSTGFLVIGITQTIYGKFFESYWIFMLSALALLWFRIRKQKNKDASSDIINKK